jgi:hypothetical protein
MEKRKAFNFYRSYYDVVVELESDNDKLQFLMAVLEKQFNDTEPKLTGHANFAYISQRHSIESQVEGYKHKVGYQPPSLPPTEPPTQGTTQPPTYVSNTIVMTTEPPYQPPSVQEQEKGEEKEKEQGQELDKEVDKILSKLNIA